MGRRRRRRPGAHEEEKNHGHGNSQHVYVDDEGNMVNVRKIGASDEGVLYTMQISSTRPRRKSKAPRVSCISWFGRNKNKSKNQVVGPETNTLLGEPSSGVGAQNTQFTIKKKKKFDNRILNWMDAHNMGNFLGFANRHDVDTHLYRPSNFLYLYIDWTFTASFTAVFMTFLVYYFVITIFFGLLLMVAGTAQPECITSGGKHFGSNPYTKFNDAYELSWTTFTTVGYGNTYTSTANDLIAEDGTTNAPDCTWVVLLCNAEAFFGLLYAGMCAAILFGKVNRVQSHAKLIFANAVCLQYEEIDEEEENVENDDTRSERSAKSERSASKVIRNFHKKWTSGSSKDDKLLTNGSIKDGMTVKVMPPQSPVPPESSPQCPIAPSFSPIGGSFDEEAPVASPNIDLKEIPSLEQTPSKAEQFVDQFNGCPILKFQVVNEMCNREGSELVDAIMKVVGIKYKSHENGTSTHAEYVRVNLVDFEHPFLSRVWHGVHILDATSPLLSENARRRIRENKGSWPTEWFDPKIIKKQLEFNDIIVTVAGISNVSALTVHAYKRYKIGDVLIGFNFAPLVFRDNVTGLFDVDLSLCHDVREQKGGGSEDFHDLSTHSRDQSTIRITKSKDSFLLGSSQDSTSQLLESLTSARLTARSIDAIDKSDAV